MLFSSCKKDITSTENEEPSKRKLTAMLRSGSFGDLPLVQNGRLVFRDSSHYVSYVNYLSEAMTIPEGEVLDTNQIYEPNEILQEIEDEISFISLRKVTNDNFEQLNVIGWNDLNDIPEIHFIKELTTLSILNADAEVVIGGEILYYHSKDYIAIVPEGADDALAQLHDLNANATFSELQSVDESGGLFIVGTGPHAINVSRIARIAANPFYITDFEARTPLPCTDPTKVTIDGVKMAEYLTAPILYTPFSYRIEWGDGSITNGACNINGISNLSHTYPSVGNYVITIYGNSSSASFNNPSTQANGDGLKHIEVPYCNFSGRSKKIVDTWYNNGSGRAMRVNSWINQNHTRTSANYKIGASTEAFEWKYNKWRKREADRVVAQLLTTVFEGPSCATTVNVANAAWPYSSRKAETEHTGPGQVGWLSIWFNHRIYEGNNIVLQATYTLTPCP